MIPNSFLEEQINTFFEARIKRAKYGEPETELEKKANVAGKAGKPTIEKDLENKSKKEGFNELYSEAAKILQKKTNRDAGKIPGGLAFTVDDIIHIINATKEDPNFADGIKTPEELANKLFQLAYDVLNSANDYVERKRAKHNYSATLAYDLKDESRKELVDSIKICLKAISLLQKKRFKHETLPDTQTLILRKLIEYLVKKGPDIATDLKSIKEDLNSSNPKTKAEATANSKNLDKQFNTDNSVDKITKAFAVIKKYSGKDSLTWPTLDITLKSGDDYKSLFKYLDMYAKGTDAEHANKWSSQFKSKERQEEKRKKMLNLDFKKKLAIAVKARAIDKIHGKEQTIKYLQSVAKQLLKDNPEFKAQLSNEEGIKHTAIDEVVGMLSTFIKHGAYHVKVE